MPASEKTWRDQKTLHVVFGCTGLLLLIATVWMFKADHTRQWKQYQRKMRDVDVRLTQWRMNTEQSMQNAQRRGELTDRLEEAESGPPPKDAFDKFVGTLHDEKKAMELRSLFTLLADEGTSESERKRKREKLDKEMAELVSLARFDEEKLLSLRKFKMADYDQKRANYDLGIRDNALDRLDELQRAVDDEKRLRDELNLKYQSAADYRKQLDEALRAIKAPQEEIDGEILELQAEYDRLAVSLDERRATFFISRPPFVGKRWLELPILDAFNSPLKIDNLWTDNLTITNGSFGKVRRFDRCTTCHQAIDRTAAGSSTDPLYDTARELDFVLSTPDEHPTTASLEDADVADSTIVASASRPSLSSVYGISLAQDGLVNGDDVTIKQLLPETLAATAHLVGGGAEDGLKVGDVLLYIRDSKVLSVDQAERYLLEQMDWGTPVHVKVLRGLPEPFSSHPRIDLFVGSTSPHKLSVFGCTVCHEGQGSATNFKWASHSPNGPKQEAEWVRKYGWFSNHHWIYPMNPARFAESSCLKCHHDVVELEVAQYDEPAAPKLVEGYHLIRRYGCFGCHEIDGFNGPDQRVGPDMRLEPNYSAAAAQIKSDDGFANLTDEQRSWVDQVIQHPERTEIRHELLQFLKADSTQGDDSTLATAQVMIPVLNDVEVPGTLRKAGPSLRHLKYKVGETWLYDWLRNPTHFRKSTRMPRFFGMWDHLDEGERALSEQYEPIEILGIVKFLLSQSQELELIQPEKEAFAGDRDEQIGRGKLLFETRGCLACHQHADFSYAEATQGPDLSNVGDKFSSANRPEDVQTWMYSWLKNPSLYHPRTKMPDLFLDPIEAKDGSTTDPAADIAVYLLSSSTGWAPRDDTEKFFTPDPVALDALVKENLTANLYVKDVEAALEANRFSDAVAATLDDAEMVLAGEGGMTTDSKLLYIGRRAVTKYGCHGCHDIPGFEAAKPIGTGLADWGRKDPSKLAFVHIAEYIAHGHGQKKHDGDIDEQFYVDRLLEHNRTGFVWQKLKEPRSYDYAKARNKDSFNDRLRMPMFPLNDVEREAVVTFVLGLVAEPPAHEFVYHPDAEKQAILDGHKALMKFNCVGCHIIDPETWTLEVPSGYFEEQPADPTQTFPFMTHQFTTTEIESSAKPEPLRGTVVARISGMPEISSDTGERRILDEEGDEIEYDEQDTYDPSTLIYPFELWKPTLIDGHAYQSGVVPLEIEASWIRKQRKTVGGDLTKWLLPRVVEIEKEANPQADGKQAYGWLPPPLIGEGLKVQTDWLHGFLLEPFEIRPAVFMRMPKFNMSPDEASALVNYFAAKDNAAYPYEFSNATQGQRLDEADAQYEAELSEDSSDERPHGETRFDHVMNIVTSSDYCVQCHQVGDFVPKTSERAMSPDLSAVHRRLRPEFVRRWLANPKQTMPYTPMPVNIKYSQDAPHLGGVAQSLYHGTSLEQLSGLVDLLMNYPRYAKSRALVSELVQPPTAASETTDEESGSP